ncbi:MAG: mucoidy inhibitor MuiA family protein [Cytophagales bacterium]|uniref:DUF4139 domain-containing protein n=1 Tax=Cyclobacterium marinum TaxID=104 RepID=UPI0030DA6C72|nr:mucoidy inhibitor MuiA family protein [Cytophagales bacterium]|tara:strand:- start:10779 stop:12647 length:1869 start_codon:yes stop_codon:yes gene_type:complete
MKALSILLFFLVYNQSFAQEIPEKEVNSKVVEATVFLKGAQVLRKETVQLTKGESIVKFTNLSPFIAPKSIQLKAGGELTVLGINHQQNFLDKSVKSEELLMLDKDLEEVNEKIELENTYLAIAQEEITFLQTNRLIGGKNETLNVATLKQAAEYYGNQLTALKLQTIERNNTIKKLLEEKNNLQDQINSLAGEKEFATGEVLVRVDAKVPGSFSFELSYLVDNAGWFPSYDIRAKDINSPVSLHYKANVRQDTKVDWDNIKLTFSSAEPSVSGVAPELRPYLLNYNTAPPRYSQTTGAVTGKVMDAEGIGLPGVNINVSGTTIGTVSDFDGNYSITLPNNASQLTYSYVGYVSQSRPIRAEVMNVVMKEDQLALDEVVVTAYGMSKGLKSKTERLEMSFDTEEVQVLQSQPLPMAQVENQTTINFEINTPYSIQSDSKNYTVDMVTYELPALYQYFAVPKVSNTAYLIAGITNWEQYQLLEGEANVFFEQTFVGKSLLDVRYATDTLEISLGRDKMVTIEREKESDFTEKSFLGNKKTASRLWKTTIKNNKSQPVSMVVLDQVPVSTLEEIEVEVQSLSGGKHDVKTGEIKWEFKLAPSDTKLLELKYEVKYPRNKNLVIE